ncbi:hypothetical protein D0Z08_03270 [Nocardioides immobilis]|uniref:Uncharacterized protein n=2 Tax=Nocardioides immobilis TaxID=2049295 RepID=A0A417Y8U4_9ACTN|nr:hypothetical protein D0Z08_03270 [Nocardioides immobilis]
MLAAAAAVVLLAGCDGSGGEADPSPSASAGDGSSDVSSDATTAPTTDAPISQDEAVACPAGVVELDPELPDEVPEGATSVRLCAGGDDEVTPPTDALVTEVAAVVAKVNDQPVVTRGCADRRLPTYQLAFGYPDGSTFVVAGRFTGCAEVLVGSGRRAKAGPPLRTFVDSLVAQRATAAPPDRAIDPADLDCAQQREEHTWPLADPTGLIAAVMCVGDPDSPQGARRTEIRAGELETVLASIRTDSGPPRATFGCGAFNPQEPWIVGTNVWGDPITMTQECLDFMMTEERAWKPRGKAAKLVNRLIDRAR